MSHEAVRHLSTVQLRDRKYLNRFNVAPRNALLIVRSSIGTRPRGYHRRCLAEGMRRASTQRKTAYRVMKKGETAIEVFEEEANRY